QECWSPQGACRAGGHAAIGAISGGHVGALAAGASSQIAPQVHAALTQAGVPEPIAGVLVQGAAVAVGTAVGGDAAAAAAFNEASNNAIFVAPLIYQGLIVSGVVAARQCVVNPTCMSTIAVLGIAAVEQIRRLGLPEGADITTPGYDPHRPDALGGNTATPNPGPRPVTLTASPAVHDPVGDRSGSGYQAAEQDRGVQGTISPAGEGPERPNIVFSQNPNSSAAKGAGKLPGPATDRAGNEIGRIVVDSRGNAMIEPLGGRTGSAGKGGVDTHTLYPNGSNYQRLNPQGHGNNPTPHGHGHAPGTGPGMKGQGSSLDVNGNVVPWNSPAAHWPIY
ncbi:hypothetical protein WG922_21875, partial [Ramlibacter sp. AN1015]|uniref:hypothetical protein n=1 Tax=Ramlibacter sp. AN1015 TaxID=3133428 RepID=UPI0030BA43B0